jgi:hypothetical protein
MRTPTHVMNARIGAVAVASSLVLALAACTPASQVLPSAAPSEVSSSAPSEVPSADALAAEAPELATAPSDLAQDLLYIIEEEKLAHDVYAALADQYGARIFENISASEAKHQSAVETLLAQYGVDDPRSPEAGEFTDPDLQALYDSLMAAGSESFTAAVEVGILIEQTDIADLEEMMDQAPQDVNEVLARLLAGSENHLAAFQRQA